LSTVASALGLTQHAAGRTVPNLAAYHAGLATASVLAVIAACVARFVDDRAAAATMHRPEPLRHGTAAAHALSAGCHHPAFAGSSVTGPTANHKNQMMLAHQAGREDGHRPEQGEDR
jgi:hypothetical protein